jgi:predicted DNA-binding helix-hairpin-helix protein
VSINIELPREEALADLAPEKTGPVIRGAMGKVRLSIEERSERGRKARRPRYAPAGQSTQMIVGADGAPDGEILAQSSRLYGAYGLRRVYYSAFSPIPDASSRLPLQPPPLLREHRLYQADWLMRFYGYTDGEIAGPSQMLDLAVDPKLAWALANRGRFPVDVNSAEREMLLRVPGLGVKTVGRMLSTRRVKRLTLEDVARLAGSVKACRAFIVADDWTPGALTDSEALRGRLTPPPRQLELF